MKNRNIWEGIVWLQPTLSSNIWAKEATTAHEEFQPIGSSKVDKALSLTYVTSNPNLEIPYGNTIHLRFKLRIHVKSRYT